MLQLNLMKNYIYSCRHRDSLLAVLGEHRYYMEHLELFTLRDLLQVALRSVAEEPLGPTGIAYRPLCKGGCHGTC